MRRAAAPDRAVAMIMVFDTANLLFWVLFFEFELSPLLLLTGILLELDEKVAVVELGLEPASVPPPVALMVMIASKSMN